MSMLRPVSSGESLSRIVAALESAGSRVERRGQHEVQAQCPGHTDRTPSLNVRWTDTADGGKVLVTCYGPCELPDILDPLGLGPVDLFDTPLPPREERPARRRRRPGPPKRAKRATTGRLPARLAEKPHQCTWEAVEDYPYCTADGELVQFAHRLRCTDCGNKSFRQSYIDRDGRQVAKKPDGFAEVLYRMPEVAHALAQGQRIWLVEGEKDVAAAEALGLTATTNVRGAAATANRDLLAPLASAAVAVVVDHDAAGYKRGLEVGRVLAALGCPDLAVYLPRVNGRGADLADHLDAGYGIDDLIRVPAGDLETGLEAAQSVDKARMAVAKVSAAAEEIAARHDGAAAAEDGGRSAEQHLTALERWVHHAAKQAEEAGVSLRRAERAAPRPPAAAAAALADMLQVTRRDLEAAADRARSAIAAAGRQLPDELIDPRTAVEEPDPADVVALPGAASAPGQPAAAGHSAGQDQTQYRLDDNGIVRVAWVQSGGERVPKATHLLEGVQAWVVEVLMAAPVADVIDLHDPGIGPGRESRPTPLAPRRPLKVVRRTVAYRTMRNGQAGQIETIQLDEDDFGTLEWVDTLPGNPQWDSGRTKKAQLLDAIKQIGGDQARQVIAYQSTGWHEHPEHGMVYVTAKSAIHAHGEVPVETTFGSPLDQYELPTPTADPASLRSAYDELVRLLSALPPRLVVPLVGHIIGSTVHRQKVTMSLFGPKATGKTGLATCVMGLLGYRWDHSAQPTVSVAGMGATPLAVQSMLGQLWHSCALADDVAPMPTLQKATEWMEMLARAVYNGQVRHRKNRDRPGTTAEGRIGAALILTSEIPPGATSGSSRILGLPVGQRDIDIAALRSFSAEHSRHMREVLTAGIARWVAAAGPRDMACWAVAESSAAQQRLTAAGFTDNRRKEGLAGAWVGWRLLADGLLAMGAITEEEAKGLMERTWAALIEAGEVAAAAETAPATDGEQILELLRYGLGDGGLGHLVGPGGEPPDKELVGDLGAVGWKPREVGGALQPKGEQLGRVQVNPHTGVVEVIVRDRLPVQRLLAAVARSLGEPQTIDPGRAFPALKDAGALVTEPGRAATTVKRSIGGGKSPRVHVIRLDALLHGPDDDPEQPGSGEERPDSDPGPGTDASATPPPGQPIAPPEPEPEMVIDLRSRSTEAGPPNPAENAPHPGAVSEESVDPSAPPTATPPVRFDLNRGRMAGRYLESAQTCIACHEDTMTRYAGHPLHGECAESTTAMQRPLLAQHTESVLADRAKKRERVLQAAGVSAPPRQPEAPPSPAEPPAPVAAPPVQPVAQPPQAPPAAPEPAQGPVIDTAPRISKKASGPPTPTRPVAVLHTDGLHLPGDRVEPVDLAAVRHVGDLAGLAHRFDLGCEYKGLRRPGQVWLTGEAMAALGIDLPWLEPGMDPMRVRDLLGEATANHPLVTRAVEAGLAVGRQDRQGRLDNWTRVGDGGVLDPWLVVQPLLTDIPGISDESPDAVVRRLTRYAELTGGAPMQIGPGSTFIEHLRLSKGRDKDKVLEPVPAVTEVRGEPGMTAQYDWSRPPAGEEERHAYVHAYDRSAAYLAAKGVVMGYGDPVHHGGGIPFDPKLPGYWLITVPEPAEWLHPSPLWHLSVGPDPGSRRWVTTPTLEMAHLAGYEPAITEAIVWPNRSRVLDIAGGELAKARAAVVDSDDPDDQAVLALVKAVYTRGFGLMGHAEWARRQQRRKGWAPHRYHMLITEARKQALYRVLQIGNATGRWPVAMHTDTVLYTSDDPDPRSAWPGEDKHWGRTGGQYHWVGSALLADHAQHLRGGHGGYRGLAELTTDWQP